MEVEPEVAGHVVSTVGKWRVTDAQFASFLVFSLATQPMEWYCPHLEWLFPSQLT